VPSRARLGVRVPRVMRESCALGESVAFALHRPCARALFWCAFICISSTPPTPADVNPTPSLAPPSVRSLDPRTLASVQMICTGKATGELTGTLKHLSFREIAWMQAVYKGTSKPNFTPSKKPKCPTAAEIESAKKLVRARARAGSNARSLVPPPSRPARCRVFRRPAFFRRTRARSSRRTRTRLPNSPGLSCNRFR